MTERAAADATGNDGTRTVSTSTEVTVDPATAFTAFTDELDLWWIRGPINSFDSSRAIAMVCEPGIGGRLLEVYDQSTGEGLELGRITVWKPGERLAFTSSIDDVTIDIRFEATATGTRVTVDATIPAAGTDQGGTAWARTVPRWFPAWCARRQTAPRPQPELARLAVGVYYRRPAAAARWLADAFGFHSPDGLPTGDDPLPETEYGHPWIEFRVGTCSIMVFKLDDNRPDGAPAIHEPWVYVDDLDGHLAHAQAAGAAILSPIRHTGFRAYTAGDLEGNRWTFLQARPTQ